MNTEYNMSAPADNRIGHVRIANACHMLVGAVFAVAGLVLLLTSLSSLREAGLAAQFGREVTVAIMLMLVGGANISLSMRYWGFRFSEKDIGKPGLSAGAAGTGAAYLQDILDNGVREGDRLPGAVGGFLGWVTPRLHMAPWPVRLHAYVQALRAINLGVILGGFVLAWAMADASVFPYMAGLFFLVALAEVRPQKSATMLGNGSTAAAPGESAVPNPNIRKTIGFLLIAVLLPTALTVIASQGMLPPPPPVLRMLDMPTLAILVPALAGSTLYFLALSRQTRELTTSKAHWIGDDGFRIPDRTDGLMLRLAREVADPKTQRHWEFNAGSGEEGRLVGSFIYETSPELAVSGNGPLADVLRSAWEDRSTRPLVALEVFGVLVGLVACGVLVAFALGGTYAQAPMALGLLASSHFCMISAHKLWKRADFRSLVYQVEVDANYKAVKRTSGNIHRGGGETRDIVLNVTSGRLMVRVARLQTVSFAPGEPRFAVAVDLDRDTCQHMLGIANDYREGVVREINAFQDEQARIQQAHAPVLAKVPVLGMTHPLNESLALTQPLSLVETDPAPTLPHQPTT